jgi:hypothetical protein
MAGALQVLVFSRVRGRLSQGGPGGVMGTCSRTHTLVPLLFVSANPGIFFLLLHGESRAVLLVLLLVLLVLLLVLLVLLMPLLRLPPRKPRLGMATALVS